jgi:peptidoglycan/LPS O-acetylase OafA/YrhL
MLLGYRLPRIFRGPGTVNLTPLVGALSRVAKRLSQTEGEKIEVPAGPASGRIQALDGWRGISAMMVVAAHLIHNRYGLGNFATSDTGVLIFFVISGFIITKLAIGEHTTHGNFSVGRFYIRRSLRILPVFFAYLVCVYVTSVTGLIEQTPGQVYAAGAFLCFSTLVPCQWFVAHSASLGYEELFYLLFPLIFFTFAQRPRIVFGSILLGLVTFLLLRGTLQLHISFVTLTAAMFIFICSGAVAAAFQPATERLARTPFGRALWLLSVAMVIAKIIYASNYQVPVTTTVNPEVTTPLPIIFKLLPAAVTWLVVGSLYGGSRIFAFLTWRPILWVGQISYSLYLWQQLFTAPSQLYLVTSPLLFPPLMFVVAAASYYWIELPCRRISKWLMVKLSENAGNLSPTRPTQLPP